MNFFFIFKLYYLVIDEEEQREFAAAANATNSLSVVEPRLLHNRNSITSFAGNPTRSGEIGSR